MLLKNVVSVSSRFQRSVNIELDEANTEFLNGYVASPSSVLVLKELAKHVSDVQQGAFTWTGPFGSGKSSLALVLNGLLSGDVALREAAETALGSNNAADIIAGLAATHKKRRFIKLVGSSENPEIALLGALSAANKKGIRKKSSLLENLSLFATDMKDIDDGIILFIDEMGKFLEGASRSGGDVFFFQQLAEIANRSEGRLVVIGVLHMAFNEYSGRLNFEAKKEWLKIEGRFIDLGLNISGEEQVELLGRAIQSEKSFSNKKLCKTVYNEISSRRSGTSPELVQSLTACWPIHPIVAAFLGPLSRRRFGQNQRSLFGFLNSAEPSGFRDFLANNHLTSLYAPADLWDT